MFDIVQNAINSAISETVDENANTEWSQCTQRIFQSIALVIERSNIQATGDLRVNQKARVALACAQRTNLDLNLRTQLETKIVDRVGKIFAEQQLPLSANAIRARVKPALEQAARECRVQESQGVAVAPTIRFDGATLTVGCLQNKFERLAQECRTAILNDSDPNNACGKVADCLTKRGNIDIVVDFNYSDACKSLDQLAVQLTKDAILANVTNNTKNTNQNEKKTDLFTWLLPALAAFLLFVLLLVVIVRVVRSRKSPNVAYPYQTPYTHDVN